MEAFNTLRHTARQKRDKLIAKARAEYAETLTKIATLEQDLLGRDPASHRSIAACIESVIPSDRPFTTTDVLAGLEALDGARVWRKRSIDGHICRLRERGLVVRLKRHTKNEPAVYARAGVQVEPQPFAGLTLPDVVARVLQDGPLNTTELVVRMLEAGYQTEMGHKQLRDAVGVVLRGGGFTLRAGKWTNDCD